MSNKPKPAPRFDDLIAELDFKIADLEAELGQLRKRREKLSEDRALFAERSVRVPGIAGRPTRKNSTFRRVQTNLIVELRAATRPKSTRELRPLGGGIADSTFRLYLTRLSKAGIIRRSGNGWIVPRKKEEAPQTVWKRSDQT